MNIGQMMKQVQNVQNQMADMQNRLAEAELTGQAGGGMVSVTMSGRGEMRKVRLDPSLIDPNDIGVLEDLIVAACNDAKSKVDKHVESESQKIMGGLNLPPGVKLPF